MKLKMMMVFLFFFIHLYADENLIFLNKNFSFNDAEHYSRKLCLADSGLVSSSDFLSEEDIIEQRLSCFHTDYFYDQGNFSAEIQLNESDTILIPQNWTKKIFEPDIWNTSNYSNLKYDTTTNIQSQKISLTHNLEIFDSIQEKIELINRCVPDPITLNPCPYKAYNLNLNPWFSDAGVPFIFYGSLDSLFFIYKRKNSYTALCKYVYDYNCNDFEYHYVCQLNNEGTLDFDMDLSYSENFTFFECLTNIPLHKKGYKIFNVYVPRYNVNGTPASYKNSSVILKKGSSEVILKQ